MKQKEYEAIIEKLEMNKLGLEDEVSLLKRKLKNAYRKNTVIQAVREELPNLVKPIKELPKARKPKAKSKIKIIEEDVVLHLSDEHADEVVLPGQVGGLDTYNFQIALGRAEVLVDQVIEYTQEVLHPNYKFKNLWILAYGDHVNGEIHGGTGHSEYNNAIKNSLAVGQMHSLMIRDLAPHFENINVVYVPGNHGRRTMKKDYHGAHDNWDFLVAESTRLACKDLSNVQFNIPDSFSIALDINGIGFYVAHGDDIKSWNGIPFYGLARKTQRLTALNSVRKINTRYFCFGHFHQLSSMNNLDGEILINGAWLGTTPYVYESLSGFSEPSQLLHGVHPKYGITWRTNIHLRARGVTRKPERYKVDIS